MITFEEFDQDQPLIVGASESDASKTRKDRRRRKAFEKASVLQSTDITAYSSRSEAERALKVQGEQLVVGCGGIMFIVFSSIISWIIQRMLTRHFGASPEKDK